MASPTESGLLSPPAPNRPGKARSAAVGLTPPCVPKLYSAGRAFGRLREIQQQLVADRLMPVFRRLPKGSPNERLHHRGSHILAPTLARYLPLRSFKLRPLA